MLEKFCQFLLWSSVSNSILLLVVVGWYFIGKERAQTKSISVILLAVVKMLGAFILMLVFAAEYLRLDAQPGNLPSWIVVVCYYPPLLIGASGLGMLCGWLRTEFRRDREVRAIVERM